VTKLLSKVLSQEEADAFAEMAVRTKARELLELADALGLKVTIDLVPNQPLSTADAKPRVELRRKRILLDKGAYLFTDPDVVKKVVTKAFPIDQLQHVAFKTEMKLKREQ
jgi:hypothetical protein